MSLLFTESFAHHGTGATSRSALALKWSAVSLTAASGPAVNTTFTRWPGVPAFHHVDGSDSLRFQVAAAAEHATFIVGLALNLDEAAYSATCDFLRFSSDSGATAHVTLNLNASGQIEARRGTVTGTVLGTSAAGSLVPLAGVGYVPIIAKVTLHDTTGAVEVWVNGVQVLNLTNVDTKNAGTKAVLDSFSLECGGPDLYLADVWLMNGAGSVNNGIPSVKDFRVEYLAPSGNGTTSQGTGSDGNSTDNYALVDETTPDTADYVGITTDGNKDTYAMGNLASTAGSVLGTQAVALAAKSDAGAKSVALVSRSSGGTEADSADKSLLTTYAYKLAIRETDPTGASYTIGEVNAEEFGFKARP